MHPSILHLLGFFHYGHLPTDLAEISRPFCELANHLVNQQEGGLHLEGPEITVALRKLLEAKDCAVRAALPGGG